MNKKLARFALALFFVVVGMILPATAAVTNLTDRWDKVSFYLTPRYIYTFDLDGNCDLSTNLILENCDDNYDFMWLPTPDRTFNVIIQVESSSIDQPNVTSVFVNREEYNYKILNYKNEYFENLDVYYHEYHIGIYPKELKFIPKKGQY